MKKKLYFGSNFKMYKNAAETGIYLREIAAATEDLDKDRCCFFFIPSFTALDQASRTPVRDRFILGAQNMCWENKGQFTGEISPDMLKEFGVELVLVGHSERRHIFRETDVMENKKVLKALESGFTVLLAVGETKEEKDLGICEDVIRKQLKTGLHSVTPDQANKVWVAYEPVWSIGVEGTPASADYAQSVHRIMRECLTGILGEAGARIPLLYGGSVNPQNGISLIRQPDIDGLFTTRTAFQVEAFSRLIPEIVNVV